MSSNLDSRRFIGNFYLIWLDENINQNDEHCRNTIMQLRQIVNRVNTFVSVDECVDFITDRPDETAYIIVSEKCSQQILLVGQDIKSIKSIYILDQNNTAQIKLANNKCSKINGNFTNIELLCKALEQALKDDDHNEISISIVKADIATSNTTKNKLDCSFMYTQILKEILLTMDFNRKDIDEFLTFCRTEFAENNKELRNIDRLQNEYHKRSPIWWYTCQSFLYSMINKALRLMEIDIILKMGFFIRDLHENIVRLHEQQFGGHISSDVFTVYRGQGFSPEDFNQIKENQNGLLAFNSFLSTSRNRAISLNFIRPIEAKHDLVPVLLVLNIDPSITRAPFADVTNSSSIKREEEILFSMHSVFQIGPMKKLVDDDRIWEIQMKFTSENDPDFYALTEKMRAETKGPSARFQLGQLMIKLAKLDNAEHLYLTLLRETTDEKQKALLFQQLGATYHCQGKYTEAIKYCQKYLDISKSHLPADHRDMATSHNNIGLVYAKMGEYSKALEYYAKSLEIRKKSFPADHPDMATFHGNIGLVYYRMAEYSKALEYHQKSLEIWRQSLPADHPDMAISHNNIGLVYAKMGEYSKALEYYAKSLEIRKKSFPADHPDMATSHSNIGLVYYQMAEYSKALEYYEKSLEIWRQSLPADHPDMATSHNNIGLVYYRMAEYSKALEYYQKSLEIRKKSFPVDHPDIAGSHNNIGLVYHSMREYSKAFESYQKSLEIRKKSLPADHPDIATSYNNIGLVHKTMGEYSKALEYHQKSLEILKQSLPADHPDIAGSHNNIGLVYDSMGEYSKAFESYQKSLEIKKKNLPADHPNITTLEEYIKEMKKRFHLLC